MQSRESRAEFLKRFKRAALRLPSSFVDSSIKQTRKRCQRLQGAKGGHFEEGHWRARAGATIFQQAREH